MNEYNYQFEQATITIQLGDAKCVLTEIDGRLHAEGDMDTGAQGLFEKVCELWNTQAQALTECRQEIDNLKSEPEMHFSPHNPNSN